MNAQIVLILGQDGFTNGAIYALLALSILLVFSVTRVLFIPQGEFVVYGALTMAAMQSGKPLLIVWLLVAFSVAEVVADLAERHRRTGALRLTATGCGKLAYACVLAALVHVLPVAQMPVSLQALLTFALIVPLGPQLYRLFYQPLAGSSVLVLMIVSISVHMALVGLGLLIFGPEGARITPFIDVPLQLGAINMSSQALLIISTSVLLMIVMRQAFERTVYGKALRAVAFNRIGARLMGISPIFAGKATFFIAALIGVLSGILIAPLTTLYFDSGFLISLKGFVGSIIGGLVSYPVAATGAFLVGLIESFSAFWASPYKEIIVFTLLIPVLMWRSLKSHPVEEEE
ncbi:branched-chain amino acid ABC transporter permease [Burkholderia sp. NLJ2]|uniref:branched-chain amino acid ABC transporter permease n=1 Tax=Burkholderia sp. NLJ2 TaxID=3090699 RepID=UPI003C6C6651